MSVKAIEIKKAQVAEVSEKIQASAATVVVEYAGLDVESMKELRSQLRENNVELKVIKNNITRRAFTENNLESVANDITGPSAIAFSKEDATAAARVLYDYSKENPALVLKSGSLDGEYTDNAVLLELAQLPNRDGMLSMLLSVLQAPIRGLAQVTSQVAEGKEE